jgi:hypothetical protein
MRLFFLNESPRGPFLLEIAENFACLNIKEAKFDLCNVKDDASEMLC